MTPTETESERDHFRDLAARWERRAMANLERAQGAEAREMLWRSMWERGTGRLGDA